MSLKIKTWFTEKGGVSPKNRASAKAKANEKLVAGLATQGLEVKVTEKGVPYVEMFQDRVTGKTIYLRLDAVFTDIDPAEEKPKATKTKAKTDEQLEEFDPF